MVNGRDHKYMKDRWKRKSSSYPRYKDSSDVLEARIMDSVKRAGVDFCGKSVLDVGCGTGVYTIRLAKEAESVTGVDISEEMLAILELDAEAEGCRNIETTAVPWDSFSESGRKWDIAVSTMTPAVQLPEDFSRMRDYAKEAVVYLGWGGRRDVEPVMDILGRTGGGSRSFDTSENLRKWLTDEGIKFHSEFFDEVRTKTLSRDDAVAYCQDELEIRGAVASKGEIETVLDRFTDMSGIVSFKISVRLELIVYKK